jgi:hypothetical protein
MLMCIARLTQTYREMNASDQQRRHSQLLAPAMAVWENSNSFVSRKGAVTVRN